MWSALSLQELFHTLLKIAGLSHNRLGKFGVVVSPVDIGLNPVQNFGRVIIGNLLNYHQVTFLWNGLGMKDALGTNLLRTFQGLLVPCLYLVIYLRE